MTAVGAATPVAAQQPAAAPQSGLAQAFFDDSKALRVNGVEIARSEIERGYSQLAARGLPDNPMNRLVVRNELIAKELFRQSAMAQGLDKSAEVQRAIDEARTNALVQAYVARNLQVATITDAQVRSEYDKTLASMGPKEFKARLILFADGKQAQTVQSQIAAGQIKFEDAAKQYSRHVTAGRGGELDWVSFKLPPQEGQTNGTSLSIANALSTLTPGNVSPLIQEQGGVVLLKMEQARTTVIPSFEQSAPALKRMLEQKERERATVKLVTDLLARSKVEQ